MLIYIKNRSDFAPVLKVNSEKYELPLATVGTESGSITIPEELDESLSGNWVYILDHVVLITQVSPKDGETKIATADPSAAFDRQCPWPDNPAATYGGFIAAALQADYKACADEAYALAYLSISNTDATPLTVPEPDGTKLYKLSDIIAQARRSGVRVDFTVATTAKASDTLSVEISTAAQSDSYIVFSDGKSQLSSETFSSDSTAKVTVMQEVEQADSAAEPVYISTDYYLSASGDVSTSVPASRAVGKWTHTTCKSNEDPAATAAAIFAQNINSHKIEFYSSRTFDLLSPVTMRLNKTVYNSRIIYIGKSSKDSRTLYKCGELATTLTDKIRASGGTAVYKTTVTGGGGAIADNSVYTAALQDGSVTLAKLASDVTAALGGVRVSATGTDGYWTYRKYSDGTFDAWATVSGTITNGYAQIIIPSFTVGKPEMYAQLKYASGAIGLNVAMNTIISVYPEALSGNSYLYFRNGNAGNITGNYYVALQLHGNWQ